MTLPKRRLPGTTYFLSPTCDRKEFRLRPDPETNAAFAFSLCESAMRHGVDIIAVMQMSSHYHAVVYDRVGRLSDFLRDFHSVMGRFGSLRDDVEKTKFWSADDDAVMELGDMETVVEKVAYTLANPTKDFIVERPEDWIGVMTPVDTLGSGGAQVFQRPERFFDPDGETSESVGLWSDYPWELDELMPGDEFRKRVKARVEQYVAEASAEVKAGRRSFMGVEKARSLSVWHRAARPEDEVEDAGVDAARKKKKSKRVAAAEKSRLQAMLEALAAFEEAHKAAWRAFASGLWSTVFPRGTWKAWRFYGAQRVPAVNTMLEAPS